VPWQNQFSYSPNQLHQLCHNTKPFFIFSQPAASSVCHDNSNFAILPSRCINCAITQKHFSFSPNQLHHVCHDTTNFRVLPTSCIMCMLWHKTNFHVLPTSCIKCMLWHKTIFHILPTSCIICYMMLITVVIFLYLLVIAVGTTVTGGCLQIMTCHFMEG